LVGKGSTNGGSIDLDFSDDALFATYTHGVISRVYEIERPTAESSFSARTASFDTTLKQCAN
jgi:hypothetical protein